MKRAEEWYTCPDPSSGFSIAVLSDLGATILIIRRDVPCINMASEPETGDWVASGGTVKQVNKGKVYVSASGTTFQPYTTGCYSFPLTVLTERSFDAGETYRSWKKASQVLKSSKGSGTLHSCEAEIN